MKSFSNFRFKCARNLVARDEVKKNAAKLAKNAWLAMDKIKENIIPNAAPDLLTDFLRNAIVISVSGANVEKSQRVGGMTGGSTIENIKLAIIAHTQIWQWVVGSV